MMTVVAIMADLFPMRRIAAPMVGVMRSVTPLTLIILSAIYARGKEWSLRKQKQVIAPNRYGWLAFSSKYDKASYASPAAADVSHQVAAKMGHLHAYYAKASRA